MLSQTVKEADVPINWGWHDQTETKPPAVTPITWSTWLTGMTVRSGLRALTISPWRAAWWPQVQNAHARRMETIICLIHAPALTRRLFIEHIWQQACRGQCEADMIAVDGGSAPASANQLHRTILHSSSVLVKGSTILYCSSRRCDAPSRPPCANQHRRTNQIQWEQMDVRSIHPKMSLCSRYQMVC